MKKSWAVAIAIITLLVLAGGVWLWLKPTATGTANKTRGEADRAVTVAAEAASLRTLPITLTALGTVQGFNTVTVRSRIDGQITKINFREGQEVTQGDLLVQLDSRNLEALLGQVTANLHRDQAQLEAALSNQKRIAQLGENGFASAQAVEAAKSQVEQLRATVESDQAAVVAAKTQLSFTQIRAPISGRSGIRTVDEGNIVRSSDPNGIVTISQITPVAVIFNLPANDFIRLNRRWEELKRQQIPLVVLARDGTSGQTIDRGLVMTVDNQIDTTTGTIKLKARFPNLNRSLWPGQFVSVAVELAVVKNALTVPEIAIQRGPDGTFVFVLQGAAPNQTVTLRPVKTSHSVDGFTLIDSGLAAGESVVTVGQFRLKEGSRVTVSDPNAPAIGGESPPAPEGKSDGKKPRGKPAP
ncbi:MAG: efflux RND transporter periplasmic adaptor subunit [Candidatus Pacebacteria bacterium]|nr:efflux RND transporter periplasmic adaptor subunit [Candidatus Paceibacterota bacterium]